MMHRKAHPAIVLILTVPVSLGTIAMGIEPPSSLKQRLDRLVLDYYPSPQEPGAAVLVMLDGKPVLRKGYGLADVKTDVKLKPNMIFRIGSITKQFTAIAVLQLAQKGKVALEDPITKHLPDFDTRNKTITIEHLLSHSSGLPNYTVGEAYQDGMARKLTPAEIVEIVAGKPLEFEPGSRFSYSNTNYVVLGMLIEKATGLTYAKYVDSAIARPLGLTNTRYGRDKPETPRHARGHELDNAGAWGASRPLSMTQPYAAGAIESTVDDLAKWTLALDDGKVIDMKWLQRAWTPFRVTEGSSDYGFGWFIRSESGERWIGHNGGINGFRSAAVWIPEKRVFVAILRNGLGGPAPDVLLRRLALEAVGRPEAKRVAITLSPDILDRYVGVYALSPAAKFTITRQGKRLIAEAPNKSTVELFAEAVDKFFSPENDVQFSFTVENGKATQMTLRRGGRDSVAKRVL